MLSSTTSSPKPGVRERVLNAFMVKRLSRMAGDDPFTFAIHVAGLVVIQGV